MRNVWVERTIDVPAPVVWRLLTEVEHWAEWGPSIRGAAIDGGRLRPGATGTITTVGGLTLPFEITSFVEGRSWGWDVAGIGATDHRVEVLDAGRCRAGFGVPRVVAPYTIVCHAALRRLDALAATSPPSAADEPG